jgi:adenylosuccinate lyase
VIDRYTRAEMGALWTDEARMEAWRRVEVAAAEELEGPSPQELEAIRAARFTVGAVRERERVTDHDVAAFVDVLAASAGPPGRWIHFGLTSSDVLDTALALQLRAAGELLLAGAGELVSALAERAREHVDTVTVGRTHGVHAEPTTFGIKLAGFAFEAERNRRRLARAFEQAAVGAISGAVGTYAAHGPDYERRVLDRLGLASEPVSTQVVARDRHAEVLQAVALAGAGLERLATEVRHLQRTEVREVEEPFRAGQKGSSAMPHKRNPITAERISGLARVLRADAQAGLEDVALWHERDITHSSVERIVLPDATILLDYLQHLSLRLVRGMRIDPDRMRANLDATSGALFSQRALLALVEAGMARDDAYRIVQAAAQQAWDSGTPLRELLAAEPAAAGLDLDAVFDEGHFTRYAHELVGRLEEIAPSRTPSDRRENMPTWTSEASTTLQPGLPTPPRA